MKTVADLDVLQALLRRLRTIGLGNRRRWGTLTPHEMLCHLADTNDMALGVRPSKGETLNRNRPVIKWLALWSLIPWPHGWRTNPAHDPRAEGTRPAEFAKDRARVMSSLERISAAAPGSMYFAHKFAGNMSTHEWQRWAYLHTDHHLRQFGA